MFEKNILHMRKTLLALGFLSPATTLFCQQDSLLKKFKYRIEHYRAIGLNVAASGNFNRLEPAAGKVETSIASSGVSASYYTAKSTDRILLTSSSGFSTLYYFSKNNNQNNINKNRSFTGVP